MLVRPLLVLLLVLLLVTTSACATQVGGGLDATRLDGDFKSRNVISLASQLQSDRETSSLVSARVNMTAGLEERTILLKNVTLGIGVRYAPRRAFPCGFGFEGSLEGGAGAPTMQRFDGIGAYLGFRAAMPYRIYGDADVQRGYSIAYYTFDLVPALRGGTWGVPEGPSTLKTLGEAGAELALRVNFGSDVTSRQAKEPR